MSGKRSRKPPIVKVEYVVDDQAYADAVKLLLGYTLERLEAKRTADQRISDEEGSEQGNA